MSLLDSRFSVSFGLRVLNCARMPVWVFWVRPLRLSTHAAILAHTRRHGMRQLQHLPQLPQIVISYSNGRAGGFAVRADAHLCGPWAVEPVSQFTLTKSP